MRLASAALVVALTASALVQEPAPQDPVRVIRPPVGADPLPPVVDPPSTSLDRRDLIAPLVPQTGFEGFYRLVAVTSGGRAQRQGVRGYLSIGRRHLALHVLQAGAPGAVPVVQAGFRQYRIENGALVTTSLVGHDNFAEGQLRFEPAGMVETRQLVRTATTLRVVQGEGSWMEFVRVE